MSESNQIAYHGSSAAPNIIAAFGLTSPAHRTAAKLAKDLGRDVTASLMSYLDGPVLRPGVLDADPNWSVSLSWKPDVACFFPPKNAESYVYAVSTAGLAYVDVDRYAKIQSKNKIDRSYMKEIAARKVGVDRILGVFVVKRQKPPESMDKVVNHSMYTSITKILNAKVHEKLWELAKAEAKKALDNQFVQLKSLGATFHEAPF